MAFASLAALTTVVFAAWILRTDSASRAASPTARNLASRPVVEASAQPRAIYRHSVIPGGARDRHELLDAVERDRVVAAHYRTVSLDAVHTETLTEAHRAYVSYRIGDRVFWTKHRVTLPKGEPILTDGVHQIRARCGNRISSEPQLPTSEDEPDATEFDALAPSAQTGALARVATTSRSARPGVVFPVGAAAGSGAGELSSGTWSVPLVGPFFDTRGGARPGAGSGSNGPEQIVAWAVSNGNTLDGSVSNSTGGGGSNSGGAPTDSSTSGGPGGASSGGSGGSTSGGSGGSTLGGGPFDPTNAGGSSGGSTSGPTNTVESFPGGFGPSDVPTPVPEPGTIVLVGTGAAAALLRAVKARRRS